MILRRLQLHPFAGTADRTVEFAPGMNVILGPNEAGKSTLRRALRHVLFIPTKLSKREAETEVIPNLPLGGGDTLKVSLEFEEEGETWKIAKRWTRGNSASELLRPDGGLVTETSAVERSLSSLLGLSRGTWEKVLISAQGETGNRLEELGSGGDLAELSERLRRSVFETDGVSIEKLATLLEERHEATYGRWDRDLNRPEGNRGLDHRWTRGAGRIVNAWYESESARVDLETAETYYRRLDELNRALHSAHLADEELASWVERHEPVAGDAERRLQLEAELARVESRGKGLKEVSQEWPVAVSRHREQASLGASLAEKLVLSGQELVRTRAWEAAGNARRLLAEAEKLGAAITAVRQERESMGAVDPEKLAVLERLDRERDLLRARLESAILRVRFASEENRKIATRVGVEEEGTREIAAGEELHFDAGGRVQIRDLSGAWELEVSSGDIDVAGDEIRRHKMEEERQLCLVALDVRDVEEAREKVARFRGISQRVSLLESQLAELLGSRTVGDLRGEVERGGGSNETPLRSLAEVAAEQARIESEVATAKRESAALQQKIAAWEREYGSPDELLDKLADLRSAHRGVKEKLEALVPLPAGFEEAALFLREFRSRRETLEQRRGAVHRLQVEKAALEAAAPEFEPAEAVERLFVAEENFRQALLEGKAVDRILLEFEALRSELDSGTLAPWQRHLGEILSPLTGGRYEGLSEDLRKAAGTGREGVPLALLSAGTRACLDLAVRLSMARWFLEERGGFLLLDDPLVDLDPERQAAAAKMLGAFAEHRQVVVFTCHPSHAALLGGNRIAL